MDDVLCAWAAQRLQQLEAARKARDLELVDGRAESLERLREGIDLLDRVIRTRFRQPQSG